MRKAFWVVFLVILLIAAAAAAEYDYWICAECGRGGNTGNYCTYCGAARPVSDVNENLTKIEGETDHVLVDVLRIDGSSFVKAKNDKYRYAPEHVLDQDETTCWMVSSRNASKDKVWLAMITEPEAVDEIWIRNGFQAVNNKGKDQYPLYARVKDIEIVLCYADDREASRLKFTLKDENNGEWEKLFIGRHEKVCDVFIYIHSIYKGSSKKTTVCLADVMLVQNTSSEFAKDGYR